MVKQLIYFLISIGRLFVDMGIINKTIYSLILACSLLYIWHKLVKRKINFNDYKLYVTLFGITFISILNYFLVNKFIKIILITIIFMFFFRYLFKEKIYKCILTPIYYQAIIMISETIYAISLVIILGNDANSIINSYFGDFLSNIIVSLISLIIISFPFTVKIYDLIISFTDKIKNYKLILFTFFVMIIANTFAVSTYYKLKIEFIIVFNVVITVVCFLIVLYSFKTQNKYYKVSDKYSIAINSLKDYEDMMTKYRIANHENKNLLLTIRAMILNNEKDIPEYIDSIVEQKFKDDEKLLFDMSVIPTGGLRATIYSEILKIKENDIQYTLDIDKKISSIDLIEIDSTTTIDVCKVISIFIDNAIDEVIKLKSKNIQISIFIDQDSLNIKVSNKYKDSIEIDKIYNAGYTTKGQNRGYGLALVKNIIDNNQLLENKIEINKKLFSQILIIKFKKTTLNK